MNGCRFFFPKRNQRSLFLGKIGTKIVLANTLLLVYNRKEQWIFFK
jgi:hypothetical protein